MENPMTWGRAEQVIHEVRIKWQEDRDKMICGLSLERRITDALRREGLLADDSDKVQAVREQINAWHNGEHGVGISLNEHLGWTDGQMKAYVLRGEVPN